jgi:hypothetical protein
MAEKFRLIVWQNFEPPRVTPEIGAVNCSPGENLMLCFERSLPANN